MKKHKKNLLQYSREHSFALTAIIILISGFLLIPIVIVYNGKKHIYTSYEDIRPTTYAVVFGAGVTENNTPSAALRDRLLTAQQLYEIGTIETIIVSGDNSEKNRNETDVMRNYLIDHKVPSESIIVDPKGVRTYETCVNAREDLQIEKALLISQGFHLPRAIFLCNSLGLESSGISATKRSYMYENVYKIREIFAIYRGLLDIYIIDTGK